MKISGEHRDGTGYLKSHVLGAWFFIPSLPLGEKAGERGKSDPRLRKDPLCLSLVS